MTSAFTYTRLCAHVCDEGISSASCLVCTAVPLASCLRVFLSPHVASFLWKWISHCFIKSSSLSVIVTSTLFLRGGFRPLGVKPNRTENSAIHNQQEGKEMALLVQHNWKRKGKGYYSHLKLVLYQYCTYQSYFIGHVLCVHWHFSWFIIVIIRTYCVYKYTEHVVVLGREL